MFLEGMKKPWWIAALVVWVAVLIALQEYRDMDFDTAARFALLAGGVAAFVVWFAVGRGQPAAPPVPDAPQRPKKNKKR